MNDKADKQLLKDFLTYKDVKKLFQYRYFTAHDWIRENKCQYFIAESMRFLTITYHVTNYPKMHTVGKYRTPIGTTGKMMGV